MHLETIANDLVKMPSFNKRRESVERLLNCLSQGREFSKNIEENWREYYEEQPRSVGVF